VSIPDAESLVATLAASTDARMRDAAIRSLFIWHDWTVYDINEVCSIDLAVIRWALNHHPITRNEA
jgi:hypothetical protein